MFVSWCINTLWQLIAYFCTFSQGGITCGAIDEPRKSSKAIDERVIINFCDKNVVIARFRDKNVVIARFRDKNVVIAYVWDLRYRWDPSLSMNPVGRFTHFMPPCLIEYILLVQHGQKSHYDHDDGGGGDCGWLWWWWWWCMKSWVINRYKIAENESQTPLAAAPPVINRCCAQLVEARLCAGCSLLLSSTCN